jgi:hypothetical protein
MILAMGRDALFCIALFFEVLAALDILQTAFALKLHEAFEPLFDFYRLRALPVLAFGARLYPGTAPAWFPSAYFLAAVFFFLFCIRQAYSASEPYAKREAIQTERPTPVEAIIDAMLPAVLCACGAVAAAATLLPLLTPLLGLWIAAHTAMGRPCWFEVSRSFYLNIFLLTAIVLCVYLWAPGR